MIIVAISPMTLIRSVHHVVGGANFAMSYDPDTVRGAGCSTLQIQEDKVDLSALRYASRLSWPAE